MMITLTLLPNDGDEGQPLFSEGQPVIIFNPYAHDGLIFDEIPAPKHGTIAQSKFVEKLGVYAYKLNEHSGWYNESWLHVDEHLPEMVSVDVPNKQAIIDGLLDELLTLKTVIDICGTDEDYAVRFTDVIAKLKEVAG